jgi:predicted nucleic acid-binding protein
MIHLDTNYIIGLVTKESRLGPALQDWLTGGETLAASAIAWSEFVTGPVSAQQIRDASAVLGGRILPFGEREAVIAARLYNHAGRKRALRLDSFIAAVAISSSAPLATENQKDFVGFTDAGLRLAEET